jgi:hypothetical protein
LDDSGVLATEALTFLAVGLIRSWRLPLGYFLTHGSLTAAQQKGILKDVIIRLHDVGVQVRAVVFDGTTTNIATLELLGATIPSSPHFQHPCINSQIFVILDPPHMLKLARNCLAKKDIVDHDGGLISWSFIVRLHQIQQKLGLRFGNKLSAAHVDEWFRRKMRVKLAAQVLSRSVAEALTFLMERKEHGFLDSEPTIKFCLMIDT